jgi:hypothetical protein
MAPDGTPGLISDWRRIARLLGSPFCTSVHYSGRRCGFCPCPLSLDRRPMFARRLTPVAQEPAIPTARGPAFDRPTRPRHFVGPARRSPRVRAPWSFPIHTLLMVAAAPHVTEAGEVVAVALPGSQRQPKGRGLFPGRPRWPPLLPPGRDGLKSRESRNELVDEHSGGGLQSHSGCSVGGRALLVGEMPC